MQELKIRLFREGAIMPTRGTTLAAGFDLYAWLPPRATTATVDAEAYPDIAIGVENGLFTFEDLKTEHLASNWQDTVEPGSTIIHAGCMVPIKTGLNMRIPAGYEVQIRPRSGLAFKNQITVQNSPGTIDADYDGDGEKFEVVVMLRNEGADNFRVNHGDRIAQMVVNKLPDVVLVEDFEDNTNRNSNREGGLGSTGK
jgi:dUTP pyrophosphatase